MKWLTPQAARDPQLRERFLLSARITRTVEHPGILRVFAIEEPADEPPYLVMEALEGEPPAPLRDQRKCLHVQNRSRGCGTLDFTGAGLKVTR